ncbi:MAG: hypothetical protein H6844_13125 [Alphaproteobacteria bacterium]|nr:hypothetical protein [Alphaproteobacteria bacterium]
MAAAVACAAAAVICADLNADARGETAAMAEALGATAVPRSSDVTDEAAFRRRWRRPCATGDG